MESKPRAAEELRRMRDDNLASSCHPSNGPQAQRSLLPEIRTLKSEDK